MSIPVADIGTRFQDLILRLYGREDRHVIEVRIDDEAFNLLRQYTPVEFEGMPDGVVILGVDRGISSHHQMMYLYHPTFPPSGYGLEPPRYFLRAEWTDNERGRLPIIGVELVPEYELKPKPEGESKP